MCRRRWVHRIDRDVSIDVGVKAPVGCRLAHHKCSFSVLQIANLGLLYSLTRGRVTE